MKYNAVEKVSREFEKWINFCEKERLSSIGAGYDDLKSYRAGAGKNIYTVFARIYKEKTGIDVQGQPWCDSFVDTVFIHLFGVEMAKRLLGGFSAYPPVSAQYFKNMKRWITGTPKEGCVGFFRNKERSYHTFYVREFKNQTRSISGIEESGGCVAQKSYEYSGYRSKIPGFGAPDYSLVEEYIKDWIRAADNVRWWYQRKDGSYPADKWCIINHHYYLFDRNGYMVTGWHRWNGEACDPEDGSGDWYYLDSTKIGPLQGACWHSRDNGAQEIWYVDGDDDI